MEKYNSHLRSEGIQPLPGFYKNPRINRRVLRDIPVLGDKGLTILKDVGLELSGAFTGCTGCGRCERECPGTALTLAADRSIHVDTSRCLGTACYRCQMQCPEKVFEYASLRMES